MTSPEDRSDTDLEPTELEQIREEVQLSQSPTLRWTLMTIGTISTGLGIAGIVLPLVPTTPFLLLAAACYARSSQRFYVWLLTNRWVGKYIRDWRAGRGIPLRAKVLAITMLWLTLGTSAIFFVPLLWVKLLLACVGIGVTTYLVHLPTRKE